MAALFEDYGKWPVDPIECRKKRELVKISPGEWKHLVHGEKKHAHVSLIASTNYAQVGYVQLVPGSSTELENHKGDEVLYVTKGKMAVRIVWTKDLEADAANANHPHYEVSAGEAFLIPEGYIHQYVNLTEHEADFFFGLGPDF